MNEVTAIFDDKGKRLFETAIITKVTIAPSKTFATHILEDGETVSDNAIQNQTRISMALVLDSNDFKETYKNIKSAFNKTTKLTIQTKADTFVKMYIEAFPHEESPDILDTIIISIDFIEQKTSEAKTRRLSQSDVARAENADTKNRGEQLAKNDNKTTLQKIMGA